MDPERFTEQSLHLAALAPRQAATRGSSAIPESWTCLYAPPSQQLPRRRAYLFSVTLKLADTVRLNLVADDLRPAPAKLGAHLGRRVVQCCSVCERTL